MVGLCEQNSYNHLSRHRDHSAIGIICDRFASNILSVNRNVADVG